MNKGFTLIELLAVIVILSIIAIITTVSVNSTIDDASSSLSKVQEKKIEEAAQTYYLKEGMSRNDDCISISELINKGYIEGDEVKDLESSEAMTGYVKVIYSTTTSDTKYYFEYQTVSCE